MLPQDPAGATLWLSQTLTKKAGWQSQATLPHMWAQQQFQGLTFYWTGELSQNGTVVGKISLSYLSSSP